MERKIQIDLIKPVPKGNKDHKHTQREAGFFKQWPVHEVKVKLFTKQRN